MDNRCIANVLSRAETSAGKYISCFNIEYLAPTDVSEHHSFTNLDNLKNIHAKDSSKKHSQWTWRYQFEKNVFKIDIFDDAKQNKLTSCKSNNVYQAVPNTNRKCIYLRWVYNLKAIIDGARPKPWLWRREFNNNLYQIQIYPHAPKTHWE